MPHLPASVWWVAMVAPQIVVVVLALLIGVTDFTTGLIALAGVPLPAFVIALLRESMTRFPGALEVWLMPSRFVVTEHTHSGQIVRVPSMYAGWVRQGRALLTAVRAGLTALVALLAPWVVVLVFYVVLGAFVDKVLERLLFSAVVLPSMILLFSFILLLWSPIASLWLAWRAGLAPALIAIDGRRLTTEAGAMQLQHTRQSLEIHRGTLLLINPTGSLVVHGARSVLDPLRDAIERASTDAGSAVEVPDALRSIRTSGARAE